MGGEDGVRMGRRTDQGQRLGKGQKRRRAEGEAEAVEARRRMMVKGESKELESVAVRV